MIFVSIFAYGVFYYNFIPQVGLERIVHLQFGLVGPLYRYSLSLEKRFLRLTHVVPIAMVIPGEPRPLIQAWYPPYLTMCTSNLSFPEHHQT